MEQFFRNTEIDNFWRFSGSFTQQQQKAPREDFLSETFFCKIVPQKTNFYRSSCVGNDLTACSYAGMGLNLDFGPGPVSSNLS